MTDDAKKKAKARARVIKQIKALLNKTVANGCTEGEADAAAKLARDLMEKYKITGEELRGTDLESERKKKKQRPPRTMDMSDFWAYPPEHKYWHVPSRKLWPAESIRSLFGAEAPSELDNFRATHTATWCPGKPTIILNTLALEAGLIPTPGHNTFNLYRPPMPIGGDPGKIKPWMEHGAKMWGEYQDHINSWLAYRVQHPDDKINHGLVMGSPQQGIGKDLYLSPVRRAIGEWNFKDVSAVRAFKKADSENSFLENVILRINEAHDLGEDRFSFYDRTKDWMAGPPETLNVVDKWIKQHSMMNLVGCIITTNHRSDGLYIPPEDRRHYAAWSDVMPEQFTEKYWIDFANWLVTEGNENVAAYLATLDVRNFNPKARPPKTEFWQAMVNASRHTETSELLDVLETVCMFTGLGEPIYPSAVTIDLLTRWARAGGPKFKDTIEWLGDRSKRRQIPHRLERISYTPHTNTANEGLWVIKGRRQVVYVRRELTADERQAAVRLLLETNGESPVFVDDGQVYYTGAPERDETNAPPPSEDDFEPSDVYADSDAEPGAGA